jgi:hypothetical protein
MKRKIICVGIAALITITFLFLVLFSGGSAFNFIPYFIHESISKGGEGESLFIKVFDVLSGGLIFLGTYKLLNRLMGNKS